MTLVRFVVEAAGCNSCATRVRKALAAVAEVRQIEIDEAADTASALLSAPFVSEDQMNNVLREASMGAGHTYRVRSGSWREELDHIDLTRPTG